MEVLKAYRKLLLIVFLIAQNVDLNLYRWKPLELDHQDIYKVSLMLFGHVPCAVNSSAPTVHTQSRSDMRVSLGGHHTCLNWDYTAVPVQVWTQI